VALYWIGPAIPYKDKWASITIEEQKSTGLVETETKYHLLYYMAEKWCIDALNDQTMDCIRAFHLVTYDVVHPDLVVSEYRNTHQNSPLRLYLCRSMAVGISNSGTFLSQLGSGVIMEEPRILIDTIKYFRKLSYFEDTPDPDRTDVDGDDEFYVLPRNQLGTEK